jgi:hypothetical protein
MNAMDLARVRHRLSLMTLMVEVAKSYWSLCFCLRPVKDSDKC